MLCVARFVAFGALFGAAFGTAAAAAQSSYQVITLTEAGSIKGTVKWSGPAPQAPDFPITKDTSVCDPDSVHRADLERLMVGPQGGVANTVVYLKDISRGKAVNLPESRRFLDQKRCRYEPHILLVPIDEELKMMSSDATLHTVHMTGAASLNLPFPFQNQITSRKLPGLGEAHLRCNGGHVWMNAEMFVVQHPYYAVTGPNGNFELTDVPPGDYELVAWHEGWTVLGQENSIDVLTQQRVGRPIFSEPKTWEKKVSVTKDTATPVNFVLSGKW